MHKDNDPGQKHGQSPSTLREGTTKEVENPSGPSTSPTAIHREPTLEGFYRSSKTSASVFLRAVRRTKLRDFSGDDRGLVLGQIGALDPLFQRTVDLARATIADRDPPSGDPRLDRHRASASARREARLVSTGRNPEVAVALFHRTDSHIRAHGQGHECPQNRDECTGGVDSVATVEWRAQPPRSG